MKKVFYAICFMVLSTTVGYAQMEQGGIYLGGTFDLGFGSTKHTAGSTTTDGPKTFQFGINPACGYFISENFMVGLTVGYNLQTSNQKGSNSMDPDEKITSNAFAVGPFARYYIMPVQTMGFFFQGDLGIGFGKTKDEATLGGTTVSHETKTTAFNVGIVPGLVFCIGPKVELETIFGGLMFTSYSDKRTEDGTDYKDSGSNFNLTINPGFFTFGVGIHL